MHKPPGKKTYIGALVSNSRDTDDARARSDGSKFRLSFSSHPTLILNKIFGGARYTHAKIRGARVKAVPLWLITDKHLLFYFLCVSAHWLSRMERGMKTMMCVAGGRLC